MDFAQTRAGILPNRSKKMKTNRGFSLLELLIVVAIILIIATIAIPSLLRSRQSAQESSAVAQIRTVNTAEVTYLSSAGGNYGSVPELITAGLLDGRFATSVSGYTFAVTASGSDYTAAATPTSTNAGRSEERRVGKECVCRRSANHIKRNQLLSTGTS